MNFEVAYREAGGPCSYVKRLGYVCPNNPDFTIRLRNQPVRKARIACSEHLPLVVWALQQDHQFSGEYIMTARAL